MASKRKTLRLSGTLLCLASLLDVASAECALKAFEIPVSMSAKRPLATLRINGMAVGFVVDSGAFLSSITEAGAAELGLTVKPAPGELQQISGITGPAGMKMTTVERLGLGDSELEDFEFLVGGNESGHGALGLLGRNFLSYTDTEYDLPNGVIRLMRPNDECHESNLIYWAGASPVKWEGSPAVAVMDLEVMPGARFPPIRAKVRVGGQQVMAVFDTGAQSILSLSAARAIGIVRDIKDLVPAEPVFGIGPGQLPSWNAPVAAVEFGQQRFDDVHLRIADFHIAGAEMLVGIDFFLSHRIYVSVPRKRIYLNYRGGPLFEGPHAASTPAAADDVEPPKDAGAYARRGMARAAQGDLIRALADLDRAREIGPDAAMHWRERSFVLARLERWTEALADVDEALRLDPSDAAARLQRIQLLGRSRQLDRVRAEAVVLDRQLSPLANMRRDLGEVELRLGDLSAAIGQYDLWISAHPNDIGIAPALNRRCWARALLGRELDLALADCNLAIQQQPNHAAYIDSRGMVRLRRREWSQAIADFDSALAIDPKLGWSLFGRGLARMALGDAEAARADMAAARALRPTIEAEARRFGIEAP